LIKKGKMGKIISGIAIECVREDIADQVDIDTVVNAADIRKESLSVIIS